SRFDKDGDVGRRNSPERINYVYRRRRRRELLQDRYEAAGAHRGFHLVGQGARYADAGLGRRDCRVGTVDGQAWFQPHGLAARLEAPIVDYADPFECDDVMTG